MISVIVPVYNVEKYIEKCINSIRHQTYKELQIILVDDGSTDDSGALCEKVAEQDVRIIVVHQSNGGLSAARNTGIIHATGEYLAFIDSDDYIHPQMMEVLLNNMKIADADLSVCNFKRVSEEENPTLDDVIGKGYEIYTGKEVMAQLYRKNLVTVVAWNKLYKRELFEKIRYPKERVHEDEAIIHRILEKCRRTVYSEQQLYFYVQRTNSIMGQMNEKRINDALTAFEDRVKFFFEKNLYWELDKTVRFTVDYIFSYLHICEKKSKENNDIKAIKKRMQLCVRRMARVCGLKNYPKLVERIGLYFFAYNLFLYKIFGEILKNGRKIKEKAKRNDKI